MWSVILKARFTLRSTMPSKKFLAAGSRLVEMGWAHDWFQARHGIRVPLYRYRCFWLRIPFPFPFPGIKGLSLLPNAIELANGPDNPVAKPVS